MPITRRTFLAAALPARAAQLDPNTLQKFVDPLPIPALAKAPYRLSMQQIETKLHRDLPPTKLWGFNGSSPGPTVEARSGEPMSIEWANELPTRHLFAIDHNLHGAESDKPEVRGIVHVHGAKVPPESDGFPEDWYVPGKSLTYSYPNQQDAATLWYHDHTMGINRLNIYAGLFGLYVIRDKAEDSLNLPKGRFEIPLVLYDRFLRKDGQLDYPVSGKPGAPWVPEVFGNAMLVNGKVSPYLDVEPRKYRFRVLNASNGRTFHFALSNAQKFHQIGTDQGLLPAPIAHDSFLLAPGERADLVIDFTAHAGERVVLTNDAFQMMQFRVAKSGARDDSVLPRGLRAVPRIAEESAVKTRVLTIREEHNPAGESMRMLLNGAHWNMPVTERPVLDSIEIWTLINATEDTHPIHLHLVRFQVIDRRKLDIRTGLPAGPAELPESSEMGWKDTVRAYSGMATRIIVRFDGYVGKYVWHCHLLEHEDNEMMRPFEVMKK